MATQAPRKWTLKVDLEGEVRRLRGWPEHGEPTYAAIHTAIEMLFDQSRTGVSAFSIEYNGQDGLLHLLTEATLVPALNAVIDVGVLRLVAKRVEGTASTMPSEAALFSAVAKPALLQPCPPSDFESVSSIERSALADVDGACTLPTRDIEEPVLPSEPAAIASPTPAMSGPTRLAGGRCKTTEGIAERLSIARPQLVEGLDLFKQQVTDDFRNNFQDMHGAFSSSDVHVAMDQQQQATAIAGKFAGAVAGVMAAGRLMPLRGARLAAHSVVAVSGSATRPNEGAEPLIVQVLETAPNGISVDVASSHVAAAEAWDGNSASASGTPPSIAEEIKHFKQQVSKDFEMAREEVNTVFGYFVEPSSVTSSQPSHYTTSELGPRADQAVQQKPPHMCKGAKYGLSVANTVAGLTAGVGVASTLLPLRAARLAIASATTASGQRHSQSGQASPAASSDQQVVAIAVEASGQDGSGSAGSTCTPAPAEQAHQVANSPA